MRKILMCVGVLLLVALVLWIDQKPVRDVVRWKYHLQTPEGEVFLLTTTDDKMFAVPLDVFNRATVGEVLP